MEKIDYCFEMTNKLKFCRNRKPCRYHPPEKIRYMIDKNDGWGSRKCVSNLRELKEILRIDEDQKPYLIWHNNKDVNKINHFKKFVYTLHEIESLK